MISRWQTLLPFQIFCITFAFYLYTLAPSLTWGDGIKFHTEVALGGSVYLYLEEIYQASAQLVDGLPFDRLGVAAWDHPLYIMLGHLVQAIPVGERAFRVNLTSAVAGAFAIALLYKLGLLLTENSRAAALAAASLSVSHTFWWHAVNAEVYTLHIVFMVSLIRLTILCSRCPKAQYLRLFALLAGLGLANHLMISLTLLPCIFYMVYSGTRRSQIKRFEVFYTEYRRGGFVCIVLFLIGFAPWWVQLLRMSRLIGLSLTLKMALGYPWIPNNFLVPDIHVFATNLLNYVVWLIYQFTPVGILVGVYGFTSMYRSRPREAYFLGSTFLIHLIFSVNYSVADQFAFHLPSYSIVALFMVEGYACLLDQLSQNHRLQNRVTGAGLASLVTIPIVLYSLTPSVMRIMGITEQMVGVTPIGVGIRDTFQVFLNPNQRGDHSAVQFGRTTIEQLEPNALVIAPNHTDGEAYLVLRYFQLVDHMRPDVQLELMLFQSPQTIPENVVALVRAQSGCRPVYLVSLNSIRSVINELSVDFEIKVEANIYRLLPHVAWMRNSPCSLSVQHRHQLSLTELIQEALRQR